MRYTLNGFYVDSTDHCGIDWGSENIDYTHSAAYFNNTKQQLDDGYDYYLIYG